MWWVEAASRGSGPSKTAGVQDFLYLIASHGVAASADGDPAAKEFVSGTVGRCMKRVPRLRSRGALKRS